LPRQTASPCQARTCASATRTCGGPLSRSSSRLQRSRVARGGRGLVPTPWWQTIMLAAIAACCCRPLLQAASHLSWIISFGSDGLQWQGEDSGARRAARSAQHGVYPDLRRCGRALRRLGLGFLHTASNTGSVRLSTGLDRKSGNGWGGFASPNRRPSVEKSTAKLVLRHLGYPSPTQPP
jgi:hypothetical protein